MSSRVAALPSVLVMAVAGCAHAPSTAARAPEPRRPSFAQLDQDHDRRLEERELFGEVLRSYDAWDLDEDGRLTPDELDVGLFEGWDANDDYRIDRAELEAGAASWLSPDERDFDVWDVDRDGSVDRDELREAVGDIELFARFDENGDGHVTDLELADAVFAYWDADGDGAIDRREWSERFTASRRSSVAAREERASGARLR